jgi:uncharacterized protein YqgC (DUF456 family)
MDHAVLWVIAILLMAVGAVGAFIPALPGIPLLFAGMVLGAWIDQFTRVGGWVLTVLGVLTLLAIAIDFAATVLGAKRAGASRQALVGAGLGTLVGLFFSLPGLILGPFIGAVLGELLANSSLERATRVGVATWIAMLVAAVARLAIVCAMVGIFALTYFLHRPRSPATETVSTAAVPAPHVMLSRPAFVNGPAIFRAGAAHPGLTAVDGRGHLPPL